MADVTPPVTPAAGTPNGGAAAATPAPSAPATITITQEQFDALNKQVAFACKGVRELTERVSPATTPAANEPPTIREDLGKLRAEILAEREESARERREASITTAIASHGVADSQADLLFDHITARYGSRIKIDGRKVVMEDPTTGERQSMVEFIGSILKTPSGEIFKPAPPAGPDTRGLGTRTTAGTNGRKMFHELSRDEQDKAFKDGKAAAWVRDDMASGR